MNRYKATVILIIVTIGYLISYPFHKTFIGGLISSGLCASMIGGFADWYGVTAIFRKPLGIPVKTELIVKNREKIFDGLSEMVSEELLSKENLKRLLQEYDTSELIIQFLSNRKEVENIKRIIDIIIKEGLREINIDELSSLTSDLLRKNLYKIQLYKILNLGIDISFKNNYDDKIIKFISDKLITVMNSESLKGILVQLVDEIKSSYEKDMTRRKLVNTIVLDIIMDLSNEKIVDLLLQKLEEYLYKIKSGESEDRAKLNQWILDKINNLNQNEAFIAKIERWKEKQINKINFEKLLSEFLYRIKEVEVINSITSVVNDKVEILISNYISSKATQERSDEYIKQALDKLIDNVHENIGKLVKENLSKYSDDMLIEMIESKAGNDLQLIRINGSVVGGLAGILIYVLVFYIGAVK